MAKVKVEWVRNDAGASARVGKFSLYAANGEWLIDLHGKYLCAGFYATLAANKRAAVRALQRIVGAAGVVA